MQGLQGFIPTDLKIRYINQLLKVGFDTIDFGSFVSPRAIPQLADTAQVLEGLDLSNTDTNLLAIVANVRGATDAMEFEKIDYLGYPLSISETFQQRNTNRCISEALDDLAEIAKICEENNTELVVYLSMGFGNPYGDPYNPEIVVDFTTKLDNLSISIVSLADTIGTSNAASIKTLLSTVIVRFPHLEIGAHLHSTKEATREKVEAAYEAGCRRIDGALNGFGGCPMAEDELVGNMATELIVNQFDSVDVDLGLNVAEFQNVLRLVPEVFNGR